MNIKLFRFDALTILACIITTGCLLLGNILAGPLPVSADNSGCSLEVKSGTVDVLDFGSFNWRKVVGDTTLQAGAKVKTASDASAVITFLDGSAMELGPDTYILIQQVDYSPDKSVVTIISQFWGKTWNRVVKMVNAGSKYEIFTPSCHAAVRGTYFMVDASLTGATTTQTFQGLVAVDAQNTTVLVPPEHSVTVDQGKAPPTPSKSQDQSINNKQDTGKENGQSKEDSNSQNKNNSEGKNESKNSGSSNAGGNSSSSNAGGNSSSSNAGGNSGSSNAGGNSGSSNAGGNSGSSNAGGNSGSSNAGGNSGSSNAGGNSGSSNAGGNSGSSNAGGNSGSSNAGGNSGSSNAGGSTCWWQQWKQQCRWQQWRQQCWRQQWK